jgi:RecJ-like exonuclease
MKTRFIEIAKRLRKAVFNNETILIRHHNDCDGITAGLSIEKACTLLMEKIGLNPKFNIYRSPSKAPFYDTTDVFRDIVLSNKLENNHGQKKPLILMLDNGSTPEDRFAFSILKSLGYECIVIDHHNPVIIENGKTSVCKYLSYHLNPYLCGLDSQTSAGMLCYELARFVNEDFDQPIMPSIAGLTDRCTIKETDDYITMSGKKIDELNKIGVAIDFLAYNLKFDSGEGIFENAYKNQEFVNLINEEVRKGVETQLQSTMPYLRTQDINGITFSYIDLEKYTLRFTYPTPGKVLGLIHDNVAEGKENPVLTIGYVSDMIIIRATKPVLPVSKIISTLKQRLPEANVDGGGHEQAGTIKFVPAHLSTIIEMIKEEIRKINLSEQQ